MTPKIIELKQAPVVLVELPKGCKHENLLGKSGDGTFLLWDSTNNFDDDNRPHGQILIDVDPMNKWKILGALSDLTEDQFAECVIVFNQINGDVVYANYIMGTDEYSAKDSFYSMLESEKVYTENPHDYMLQSTEENFDNCKCDKTELQIVREKWQEAQYRTIDPTRTVVLLRKEDVKCK